MPGSIDRDETSAVAVVETIVDTMHLRPDERRRTFWPAGRSSFALRPASGPCAQAIRFEGAHESTETLRITLYTSAQRPVVRPARANRGVV